MKNTNLNTIMVVALLFCFVSCTQDEVQEPIHGGADAFSVAQAKDCYSQVAAVTRGGESAEAYLCVNVTPVWSKANYSRDGSIESIDVPVVKKTHFIVRSGKRMVEAPQRLTILKDNETGANSVFLTTFIPDASFLESKNVKNYDPAEFETSGDKNDYTGLVLYTSTTNSVILMVNKYRDGRKVNSANIFSTDPEQNKSGWLKISKFLKGIYVYPYNEEIELAKQYTVTGN